MKALTYLATLCFEYLPKWKPVKNGAVAESGNRQVNCRSNSVGRGIDFIYMRWFDPTLRHHHKAHLKYRDTTASETVANDREKCALKWQT